MGFEGRGMGEAIAILQYSATVFSCSSDVVGISCFGLAAEVGIAAILFSICLLLRPWAILCFFCIALWCIWGGASLFAAAFQIALWCEAPLQGTPSR